MEKHHVSIHPADYKPRLRMSAEYGYAEDEFWCKKNAIANTGVWVDRDSTPIVVPMSEDLCH
jgi:hypothetical protein